jgi:hypothetical protein
MVQHYKARFQRKDSKEAFAEIQVYEKDDKIFIRSIYTLGLTTTKDEELEFPNLASAFKIARAEGKNLVKSDWIDLNLSAPKEVRMRKERKPAQKALTEQELNLIWNPIETGLSLECTRSGNNKFHGRINLKFKTKRQKPIYPILEYNVETKEFDMLSLLLDKTMFDGELPNWIKSKGFSQGRFQDVLHCSEACE